MFCRVVKKEIIRQDSAEDVYDISVEKYHNFILANGTVVHNCDTFQSTQIRQELATDGFNTVITSVDRVQKDANGKPICLPYYYLKSALYERRLLLYKKCDLLTNELVSLEKKSDGHVDHPPNGSKDQADAVCGALWNASQFAEEFSYSYGDSISAMLDANEDGGSDAYKKEKFITDFESELIKMKFFDNFAETSDEINDDTLYRDMSDGIIIL